MDLLIVDNISDFIAAKSGGCLNCSERKLGVKILRAMKISEQDCSQMRKEYNLRAVSIKCECEEFKPIKYEK
jgi:hypothetical protein